MNKSIEKYILEFTNKYLAHLFERLDYLRTYEKELLNDKPIFKSSKEIWNININIIRDEINNIEKIIKQEKEDYYFLLDNKK